MSPGRDIADVPAENSPPQAVTNQPSAQLSEQEKAYILEELDYLAANRPKLLVSCTVCGGDGELDSPCDKCGGSKQTAIPGITMFAAFAPCTDCKGSGYQACNQCTWGLMSNPNYNLESENWTERRHMLWGQLGYSASEIKRMEMDEAQVYIDARSEMGGNQASSDSLPSKVDTSCPICKGSGRRTCSSCHGDKVLQKTQYAPDFGYSGGNTSYKIDISCPACEGTGEMPCTYCGGD